MTTNTIDKTKKVNYSELLQECLNKPGKMLEAYKAFHNFSFCNNILALYQLEKIGPIKTFNQWREAGRRVKKGEKAICLWMPLFFKKKDEETGEEEERMRFVFKNLWFGYYQTEPIDGKEIELKLSLPEWDKDKALKELKIEQVEFNHTNGNCQGYASKNNIAINPLAQLPIKTLIHEIAHVLLNHTESESAIITDTETITRNLMEVEAEAVAMLCLESLDLKGSEYCRGYIQNWIKTDIIPEKSCQKIISATNKILKAGIKEN